MKILILGTGNAQVDIIEKCKELNIQIVNTNKINFIPPASSKTINIPKKIPNMTRNFIFRKTHLNHSFIFIFHFP